MKTVFTTGEAAKICKVSQQTIIRCFDSGQLKGFRVPGSKFRRIPREALYKFMKDHGIPTDALESGKRKVLLVDDEPDLVATISQALQEDGRFEVRIASNGFDAGMMVKEYHPDIIILGGGVSQWGDLLFPRLRQLTPTYSILPRAAEVAIVPARLEADVGILGAAALFAAT